LLTVDLVRARRKAGKIVPTYLAGAARERLIPAARYYLETYAALVGKTRDEIDDAIEGLEVEARDRVAALGLRKVIEDRCELAVSSEVDPEALRDEVFRAAAAAHRALDLRGSFDRDAVLADIAARRGATPAAIDAALYTDLRGSEILERVDPLSPEDAVDRYNLGLAQAILLRATRVTVTIEGADPQRYRAIFRAARFHQLIHVVRARAGDEGGGYVIELDGPFSLFEAVQRYGFRLALFLPSVLGCRAFEVRAEVLWGKEREKLVFVLGPADGLVSPAPDPPGTPAELEVFCAAFARLPSEWTVRPSERVFALPGEVVCVPDLVFENGETGEEVYLELFGFWSRAAVWRRVELIRKGFPCRILLAVSTHLKVSEEVLGEDDAGEVYVFKGALSPRTLLERLRRTRAV
jgi:uncharacterized protein